MPNLYGPKIAVKGLISDKEMAGYNNEYKYSVTHKLVWPNSASI